MAPRTPYQVPPPWALKLLHWFCPDQLLESVEGDLVEQFEEDCKALGVRRARRRFVIHVLRFFRPSILLRNKFSGPIIRTIMINNYFKVAARNIRRQKLYSFINAFGLSIGVAFCMLIFLYIVDEQSFDKMHTSGHRIYRIEEKSYDTWQKDTKNPYSRSAWVQTGLMKALQDELPEIEYATRFNAGGTVTFRVGEKIFTEKLCYVDPDFFRMFSFKLIRGDAQTVLKNKSDIVITPELATKYFGDSDPVGKEIIIDREKSEVFVVSGIIAPPPANTSFEFFAIVKQENRSNYERRMTSWGSFNTPTFVQLREGSDTAQFAANLDKVVDKYMSDRLKKWRAESTVPIPDDVKMLQYVFTPLPEMHLKTEVGWDKVSDRQYSSILGGVAILILLIASINYVSLALTTSASRRLEVGVRKSVGAQRGQLILQFSLESILLALISGMLSLGLVAVFLPYFNTFTGKGIVLTWAQGTPLLGFMVLLTGLVGMIAGSYPALVLSGFRPALVLKGLITSRIGLGFARPLVVIQFAMSSFLIISSVIMYRQMKFVTTKDLGYNMGQVVVMPTGDEKDRNKMVERMRIRLQSEPYVVSVTGTNSSFNQGYDRWGFKIKGEQKSSYVYAVDPNYIPTLDIKLVEGRNFDPQIASDSNAVIINEAFVRDLKWADPLSEHLNWLEDTVGLGAKVIGVVKDYNFLSLEKQVEPMLLTMNTQKAGQFNFMLVKLAPQRLNESVDKLRTAWKEIEPEKPFDYTFLDEDVARQYESYERWMSIMGLSTGFAILISCLGLFGLSGINAMNKTKEIGIRKVMGAEIANIFVLLNRQYVWLSLIAFVIAIPGSWYIMSKWLESFQFKVEMGWGQYVASMVAGLVVALATVTYHSLKAATINPAETLKYE